MIRVLYTEVRNGGLNLLQEREELNTSLLGAIKTKTLHPAWPGPVYSAFEKRYLQKFYSMKSALVMAAPTPHSQAYTSYPHVPCGTSQTGIGKALMTGK